MLARDMIAPHLRIVRTLFGALVASTVIYGVVIVLVTMQDGNVTRPPFPPLAFFVAGGAYALGILGLAIPLVQRSQLPPRERDGSTRVDLADKETGLLLLDLLPKLRSGLLVTWAMCESIAVIGLIGGFLFHDPRFFAPFAGAALIGFSIHAPTDAFFASFIRAVRK